MGNSDPGRQCPRLGHPSILLRSEVSSLRKANEALSKRWRAKRTRVQLRGSLTVQDAQDLLD
jgi:hypothetical protein